MSQRAAYLIVAGHFDARVRRTRVVGIVPNDAAIVRLVGALLLEKQEGRPLDGRRVFSELSMAKLDDASTQGQDESTAALAAAS